VTPLPPAPRHIVIGANAHAALSEALRSARPALEFRGAKYTDVTPDDLSWAEAYVGFKRPPLPSMGNVRWVHCTGAGVDDWLYPEELPREILLTRTSESFGPMIAEWALARALATTQELLDLAQAQRMHRWAPRDLAMVGGTTAVIVGTGDVGTHVAKAFRALGCKIYGVSRTGSGDPDVFTTLAEVSALRDVVAVADWLILTVPLTNATRGLVNRHVLSACRGAFLMNVGRGAVVEEAAIPVALENGWLRGAALDVFETEPLPTESPLWLIPHVMISPHVAGLTTTAGAAKGFLDCLADIEAGRLPKWVVDRERGY
jgi:phosphoglycerate dehydrogenase-like enzyme